MLITRGVRPTLPENILDPSAWLAVDLAEHQTADDAAVTRP
ncbi:hypothetical protein [Enteractinococcus coprophilus]|nr:hypothetical protein [Enteractinococcus coprophilus]